MVHTEIGQGSLIDIEKAHESEKVLLGGSFAETVAGAGAIVLSILGLVGILPESLLAVSIVAMGTGFILQSASIGSRFNWVLRQAARTSFEVGEAGVGMTTEFIGGAAGIGLGVLSLLGLVPNILLPIGVIIFGLTLLSSVRVQARLNDLEMECRSGHEIAGRVSREAVSTSSGIQILFGLGAATLGILSLVGVFAPITLTLVATLAVGGASLFSGASLSARMWGFARFCDVQTHGVKS